MQNLSNKKYHINDKTHQLQEATQKEAASKRRPSFP